MKYFREQKLTQLLVYSDMPSYSLVSRFGFHFSPRFLTFFMFVEANHELFDSIVTLKNTVYLKFYNSFSIVDNTKMPRGSRPPHHARAGKAISCLRCSKERS